MTGRLNLTQGILFGKGPGGRDSWDGWDRWDSWDQQETDS